MRKKLFVFLTLLTITLTIHAQTWNLVWREDFGVVEDSVIKNFPDPSMNVPNHRFNECMPINDGYYGITNSTWWAFVRKRSCRMNWAQHFTAGGDHTGNPNGAMLLVNVGSQGHGEVIYEQTMKFESCGDRDYRFTLFGACVSFSTNRILLSNLTLNILNIKDPENPEVIKSMETGDLPLWEFNNRNNSNPNGIYTHAQKEWKQFDLEFTAKEGDILKLQVLNHCSTGNGNDFVIDDISLYRSDPDEIVEPTIDMVKAYTQGRKTILEYEVSNDVRSAWEKIYKQVYFLWQRSSDDGLNWEAIPEASGINKSEASIPKESDEDAVYRLIVTGGQTKDEAEAEASYINTHGGPSNGCAYFSISNTLSALAAPVDPCEPQEITIQASATHLCEGEETTLSATTEEESATLVWEYSTDDKKTFTSFSMDEKSGTVTPQQNTFYRAKIETENCPDTYSDTLLVEVEMKAKNIAIEEIPSTICKGDDVELKASAEIDPDINTIVWIKNRDTLSVGEFTTTDQPRQASYYEFDVLGQYCPPLKKSVNVNVESSGDVWLEIDKDSICEGEVAQITIGYEETSNRIIWEKSQDNETFKEFDPNTDFRALMPTNTTYYRIKSEPKTNACPTIYSNVLQINVEAKAAVTVDPIPTLICEGESVDLTAHAKMSDYNHFQWSKNEEILSNKHLEIIDRPTESTKYQLTVWGNRCPVIVREFEVEIEKKPELHLSLSAQGVCEGDDVDLNATYDNVNDIQWQRRYDDELDYATFDEELATQKTIQAERNAAFRLITTAEKVCPHATSEEVKLSVDSKTEVELPAEIEACAYEEKVIAAKFSKRPASFTWYQKDADEEEFSRINVREYSFSIITSEEREYKLEYTAGSCPGGSLTTHIIVDDGGKIDNIPDNTICGGTSVTLKTNSAHPESLLWEELPEGATEYKPIGSGESELTVSPKKTTRYRISGSSANGCPAKAVITTVEVFEPLNVTMIDGSICEGDTILLRLSGIENYTEIKWTSSQNNYSASLGSQPTLKISPYKTEQYTAEVHNGVCRDVAEGTVEVYTYPRVFSFREHGPTDFELEVDSDHYPLYYDYGNGIVTTSNILEHPTYGMTYHITISNEQGCSTNFVLETPLYDIHIPPYFIQGRDNWEVENLKRFKESTYKIHDRFGKVVYEGVGVDDGWDGTYNGRTMPSTDYWYLINIPEIDRQFSGHFTLLRE